MFQVAIISGKGGTGKTTIAGALAALFPVPKVIIDADVDAANLAVIMHPKRTVQEIFYGMDKAVIDTSLCVSCGACEESCRFEAINSKGSDFSVVPLLCEGCAVCTIVCPVSAIRMEKHQTGIITAGYVDSDPFIYAELDAGSGNTGLLVHKIRQKGNLNSPPESLILIDGPPGIGCPLLSSITGVEVVLLVTEPSISALQDLKRLVTVCRSFKNTMYLILNKADLHPGIAQEVLNYAQNEEIEVIAQIPYDPEIIRAVREGCNMAQRTGPAAEEIQRMAANLIDRLRSG